MGIFRGKSLPLTDSADHVCFFRHALALDERRVKFLPEYVHGGVCKKSTLPEHPSKQPTPFPFRYDNDRLVRSANSRNRFKSLSAYQRSLVSGNTFRYVSKHLLSVLIHLTLNKSGGGNQLNRDLDLGRTPFLWMSFEAVSCGLHLRPTRVEWRWDHLQDMKESLTGVWHIFEWIPVKTLSYQDESSTVYRYV